MLATEVIRKPIITEKATTESSLFNRYTFEIDPKATKTDVKNAVRELYEVRVLSVATQNRKGRMRRNRFGHWRADKMKRAVVKIHPEDRIELF